MDPRRTGLLLLVAAAATVTPCLALGGTVHDDRGRPLGGATACVLVGPNTLGLCVETDDRGVFRLPGGDAPAIRISAPGFLTVDVAAVDHVAPIRLQRAARFEISVVDAEGGDPVAGARVRILSPDGRQQGPIELGASGRLKMNTFPPGQYRLAVEAEGFASETTEVVDLVPGRSVTVRVELRRVDATDGSRS